ncbi:MAG TPA: type II toxin-antitoxin system VapB family antitoxin [Sphaerochaeta sp.]|nr:type II toxin-antitoxin system VapB family antitoxin [Sphaerochaeta sp.]
MKIGSVFENNRTQPTRLPVETRSDKNIKKFVVQVVGRSRIITPVDHAWDTFFLAENNGASDDFMHDRAVQDQDERESF